MPKHVIDRSLTAQEIQIGRVYSAKRPTQTGDFFSPVWNDRQVRWMDSKKTMLQYDGPAVHRGCHYPKVSMDAFLKWAKEDVTDKLQPGKWRSAKQEVSQKETQAGDAT